MKDSNQVQTVPDWLASAVFYQIYPQSYLDTNEDGIGDLPGICSKLDYIASLGVNALWLNPLFESPFGDAGYDVSDFRKVAGRYGTRSDLKKLFREAHRRGMRVVLDLVAGHTSIEHPWFKASRQVRRNRYSDYYVWTPTVWTEGGAGRWIAGAGPRDGNYLANFFWFQPALNYGYAQPNPDRPWEQPVDAPGPRAVRAELQSLMRTWLDAGCDGFRVDMASSLVKGPPDSLALRSLWREIRGWMDRDYPQAVLVSEWSHPRLAIDAGFHVDFMIHFGEPAYNALTGPCAAIRGNARVPPAFFERAGGGNILDFTRNYLEHLQATRGRGYLALPTGNHDYPRQSRGRTAAELRGLHGMLLTLPGVPFIYYGDEIGMRYVENLEPKEGSFAHRTGSRTPMQWTDGRNKGFSTAPGSRLYLPVDPDGGAPSVSGQLKDPDSHLHFIRTLLSLRRAHSALGNTGGFRVLFAKKKTYPLVYERSERGERFVIVVNPRSKPARTEALDLPARSRFQPVLGNGIRLERKKGVWIASARGQSWSLFRDAFEAPPLRDPSRIHRMAHPETTG
jgi:maltose alpha-D-glucosyltransferase/alpha-amylase